MNALDWNRDLTLPAAEIRAREAGKTDKKDRGNGMVSLVEMRRGKIGLCVATLIARYTAPDNTLPGWQSPEIAWAQTQAAPKLTQILRKDLEDQGQVVQETIVSVVDFGPGTAAPWHMHPFGNPSPIQISKKML